jgi:hypothetical protein
MLDDAELAAAFDPIVRRLHIQPWMTEYYEERILQTSFHMQRPSAGPEVQ